jgi:hypothetical protein
MNIEFSQQAFVKYSNVRFHENPSSGYRVVPWRRTDMTKLIVAFRNFANAHKIDDDGDDDEDDCFSNNFCQSWFASDIKLTGVG